MKSTDRRRSREVVKNDKLRPPCRQTVGGRRRRQRDLLLAIGMGLTAGVAGVSLSFFLPKGSSVVQSGHGTRPPEVSGVPIQSEAPRPTPSVVAAVPRAKPEPPPAAPVTGATAEVPPAPALVVPVKPRVIPGPSVVAAPTVPMPTVPSAPVTAGTLAPTMPHSPPVIASPQLPLEEPSAPVTAGVQTPEAGSAPVTASPGWREIPIKQREPRIRVYNRTRDGGRSRLLLFDGRLRRGMVIRQPFGQVDVPPGDYRYELYFAGSALAPMPDQVGTLRCRTHTMYYFHLYMQPAGTTIREDLGDRLR